MKKRLTVHLSGVPQTTIEVEFENENGKKIKKEKKILVNTLAFIVENENEVTIKIDELSRQHTISKYYLSNIN